MFLLFTTTDAGNSMFKYENSAAFTKIMELIVINWMGQELVDYYMTEPKVLELLKSNEKFDVCIGEVFNYDAMNLGIADHFGCTVINYFTYSPTKWVDDMTGK